ncbi:nuclear transport factor 2 family protein [Gaetbulibacter sp. M240]|uniref:YybH family protein n=1 Tax=Gaetbulibacter sp. M240 TaxID=3126511 RepID=UPI00374EB9CF
MLDLEKKALDSWAMGDPLGYAENFAENATYFDDIGAQNRVNGNAALTAYFKSLEGKIPTHNYELVDPKVQVFDNVAILTLRYNASTMDNQPGPPWKSTSIYKLINGEWKVVHANWSLIKN